MRTPTEWLLLPLFLLPFAVGGGLAWFASETHQRDLDRYVHEGAVETQLWLRGESRVESVAGSAERVLANWVHADDSIEFSHPGGRGRVAMGARQASRQPWHFTRAFPSGLLPDALADAGVRLQVETGAAPGSLEGADAATVAFRRLYRERDLLAMRSAPLPVTTKRFLVRRWRENGDDDVLVETARFLAALETATAEWPRPPGLHHLGKVAVLAARGDGPSWVIPDAGVFASNSNRAFNYGMSADPPIQATWSFLKEVPDTTDLLWSGRVEEPYAGNWSLSIEGGREWWRSSLVRRWGGPIGAVLILFLLLPTALLVSIRRRRRLDELRVRFINEMAHDLRTPLTSLRLYADMLAGGKTKEEDRGRYVDVIARESARLTSLLGNLLDLSRLEGHRRSFEPESLTLDEVAEHAIGDFVALYPKRAEDIRVSGADDVSVTADRTALARCLGNLLDNAGKFTEAGTPVTLSWEEGGGHVRIVVSDGGPGIAESERDRIFDRYSRGRDAKKDGIPGTGLGLSLVRELCRGMGGGLRLLPGTDGAAFEINLPGGET